MTAWRLIVLPLAPRLTLAPGRLGVAIGLLRAIVLLLSILLLLSIGLGVVPTLATAQTDDVDVNGGARHERADDSGGHPMRELLRELPPERRR